jgi:hypothetical protein
MSGLDCYGELVCRDRFIHMPRSAVVPLFKPIGAYAPQLFTVR